MKEKKILILIFVVMNFLFILTSATITINTCDDLIGIGGASGSLSDSYQLGNSISCSSTVVTPIGATTAFSGTLDGNGFTIGCMSIYDTSINYFGLFSQGNSATFQNIRFQYANVTTPNSNIAAILVGSCVACSISNITVIDSTITGGGCVAAIAANFYVYNGHTGTVSQCGVSNTVINGLGDTTGALFGRLGGSATFYFSELFVKSSVTVKCFGCYCGGMFAYNGAGNNAYVCDSYTRATVTSTSTATYKKVGGFAGANQGALYITNVYVASPISAVAGALYVGCVIGCNTVVSSVVTSYYDNTLCSKPASIGTDGNGHAISGFTAESTGALASTLTTFDSSKFDTQGNLKSEHLSPNTTCICCIPPVALKTTKYVLNSADVFNPSAPISNGDYSRDLSQSNSSVASFQKYSIVYLQIDNGEIQYIPTNLSDTSQTYFSESCPSGKIASNGGCKLSYLNVDSSVNSFCVYDDFMNGPFNISCPTTGTKQYCFDTTPYLTNPTYSAGTLDYWHDGTKLNMLRYADLYKSNLFQKRVPFHTNPSHCKFLSLSTLTDTTSCGEYCQGTISSFYPSNSEFTCVYSPPSPSYPNIAIKVDVQVTCT